MKVYTVGAHGPEHNSIRSVHKTYNSALKAWNVLRKELRDDAKSMLKRCNSRCDSSKEIYERIIKNLSCEKPDKIDNYPHETPYIQGYKLNE